MGSPSGQLQEWSTLGIMEYSTRWNEQFRKLEKQLPLTRPIISGAGKDIGSLKPEN
jgi:hypothetical protein